MATFTLNLGLPFLINIGLVFVILYGTIWLIYTIYLGPLATIPGPKLAAATRWVETYHECFNEQGGQFQWAYRSWHDLYGPIIRIAPNEVHIRDSEFYDRLYNTKPQNKTDRLRNRFDSATSIFDTSEHQLHASRRAILEGFFSRKRIAERIPQMQNHLNRLCDIICDEYLGTGKIASTEDMWSCWTSDIIATYCFGTNENLIDLPNFDSPLRAGMNELLEPMHYIAQFPILKAFLFSLPQWFVLVASPAARPVIAMKIAITAQIQSIRSKVVDSAEGDHPANIFETMITSDLPTPEISNLRLTHEGIGLLGAGTETTMRTLSIGLYYLWERPETGQKLLAELKEAIPDPKVMPTWDTLSKLPYLGACLNEALRLSYGASQRLIRIFEQPIVYRDFEIPPGTEIGMDIYDVCHDEAIFPHSSTFKPERWLEDDADTIGAPPLSRYLVVFGKGPRSCIGRHLAYAEACLGIATFVRRFEYEMYDTNRSNFAFARDRLAPRPLKGTKGIRMRVLDVHT